MTTVNELRTGLVTMAKRATGLMSACTNQEATKLYLVLPLLGVFGYDYSNPYAVYPQHAATAPDGETVTTDLAILDNGRAQIAINCRAVGSDLATHRDSLRPYFAAQSDVKLAILTNGMVYELFVDTDNPGQIDAEPYLSFDLETIAAHGVADEIIESLLAIAEAHFDPDTIAEAAHLQIVAKRLRTALIEEARKPTEAFCRFALTKIGLANVSGDMIASHYGQIVKDAFEESLILPISHQLRSGKGDVAASASNMHSIGQRLATAEYELDLIAYIRRRLAFLCTDETHYGAIDNVQHRDYLGRIHVYYEREQRGRLFDLIVNPDGGGKYIFPEPIGEIITSNVKDIDEALRVTFHARVHELGAGLEVPPMAMHTTHTAA